MEGFTLHDVEVDEASAAEAGRSHAVAAAQVPPPQQSEAPKAELLKGIPKSDEVQ